MQVRIYRDDVTVAESAAREIIDLIKAKPTAVLCLASGDSPRLAYSLVARSATTERISSIKCTFIGLDEWVGIGKENEGSCHYFLHSVLFDPMGVSANQIHVFDGMSRDLDNECEKMDKVIIEKGGIDLMVVGVGMNGHIGFNEPGVRTDLHSHVIDLDPVTQSVGQKYFKGATSLKQGVTLGLAHLVEARKVLLLATGKRKSEIISKALEGEMTSECPASIVRTHLQSLVLLDEAAASQLKSPAGGHTPASAK